MVRRRSPVKALMRVKPTLADFSATLKEFDDASDRAAAIVGSTLVETYLERAILSRLVKLDEDQEAELLSGDAPLSSFAARIKLGYSLGLYNDETREDLDTVRDIRNAFAHAPISISFKTKEVIESCQRLKTWLVFKIPERALGDNPARSIFKHTVHHLWQILDWERRHAQRPKLPSDSGS